MNSTKRINGNYDVYANTVTVHGNLNVIGTSSSIESVDTLIKDRIITLNSGEVGAGVTGDYAGIEVDRGSSPTVSFRWSEPDTAWQVTLDGTTFVDVLTGSGGIAAAAGNVTEVQFNDANVLSANSNFTFDSTTNTLVVGEVEISAGTISTINTNQNLVLDPNGTGQIQIDSEIALEEQLSDPSIVSGYNLVYAKAAGSNGTGVFYVNSSTNGELPSDNKAKLYGLIF